MSDELRRYNDRKAAEFEWSRAQYEAWFVAYAKAVAEWLNGPGFYSTVRSEVAPVPFDEWWNAQPRQVEAATEMPPIEAPYDGSERRRRYWKKVVER